MLGHISYDKATPQSEGKHSIHIHYKASYDTNACLGYSSIMQPNVFLPS